MRGESKEPYQCDHRHGGGGTTHPGRERLAVADQLDDCLAEAQGGAHTRGRYPRPRVSVDEQTIELAGSPVFFRAAPARGAPAVYLHGIPTSSDDWLGFLAATGGLAPDLIGFGRSGKGGQLDYTIDGRFIRGCVRT